MNDHYKPGVFPTRFGYGALFESAFEHVPDGSEFSIFKKPIISLREDTVHYAWNEYIDEGETLAASYSNYYGELEDIYDDENKIMVFDLCIEEKFEREDRIYLKYDIKSEREIEFSTFSIFFPQKIGGKEIAEFYNFEISEDLTLFKNFSTSDGMGRFSEGVLVASSKPFIVDGRLELELSMDYEIHETVYPAITIVFREEGDLMNHSKISPDPYDRRSYIEASLVIPTTYRIER